MSFEEDMSSSSVKTTRNKGMLMTTLYPIATVAAGEVDSTI